MMKILEYIAILSFIIAIFVCFKFYFLMKKQNKIIKEIEETNV